MEGSGGTLNASHHIRPIEPLDAQAVLHIQAESPEIAQWSRCAYERLAEDGLTGWAVETAGTICGFMTARHAAGDVEILNLAVSLHARRQGAATLLLNHLLAWAEDMHAEKLYLEVRASNQGARAFYERNGLRETGRRPRYYSAPVEDALVLALSLKAEPPHTLKDG